MGPTFALTSRRGSATSWRSPLPTQHNSTTLTFPSWSHHSCKKMKRRKPGLPYHSTLESYNPDLKVGGEELEGEMVSFFGPSCLDPLRCKMPSWWSVYDKGVGNIHVSPIQECCGSNQTCGLISWRHVRCRNSRGKNWSPLTQFSTVGMKKRWLNLTIAKAG